MALYFFRSHLTKKKEKDRNRITTHLKKKYIRYNLKKKKKKKVIERLRKRKDKRNSDFRALGGKEPYFFSCLKFVLYPK